MKRFNKLPKKEKIELLKKASININVNSFICKTIERYDRVSITAFDLVNLAKRYKLTHMFNEYYYKYEDFNENSPLWHYKQTKERIKFLKALIKAMEQK